MFRYVLYLYRNVNVNNPKRIEMKHSKNNAIKIPNSAIPNLRKNPYRGIITELAEEFGVGRSAISNRIARRSYRVFKRFWELVEERREYANN